MNSLTNSLIKPEKVDQDTALSFLRESIRCNSWWNGCCNEDEPEDGCPDSVVEHLLPDFPEVPNVCLTAYGYYADHALGNPVTSYMVELCNSISRLYPEEYEKLIIFTNEINPRILARSRNAAERLKRCLNQDSEEEGLNLSYMNPGDWLDLYRKMYENEELIMFFCCLFSAAEGYGADVDFKKMVYEKGSLVKRRAIDAMIESSPDEGLGNFLNTAYKHHLSETDRHNDCDIRENGDIYSIRTGEFVSNKKDLWTGLMALENLYSAHNNVSKMMVAEYNLGNLHKYGYLYSEAMVGKDESIFILYQLWPFFCFEKTTTEMRTVRIVRFEDRPGIALSFGNKEIAAYTYNPPEPMKEALLRLNEGDTLNVVVNPVGQHIMPEMRKYRLPIGDFQLVYPQAIFPSKVIETAVITTGDEGT